MCTFESGSCSWTSDSKTFKITKARYTESPLTGDHTSAALEGKVMYLSTNKTGATYLTGPKLSHFSWQCFSFWYLKTGKLKLKLFAVKNLNTAQRENNLLWSNNLTDPTGEWVQIGVRINIRDEINMVFEADKNGKFLEIAQATCIKFLISYLQQMNLKVHFLLMTLHSLPVHAMIKLTAHSLVPFAAGRTVCSTVHFDGQLDQDE